MNSTEFIAILDETVERIRSILVVVPREACTRFFVFSEACEWARRERQTAEPSFRQTEEQAREQAKLLYQRFERDPNSFPREVAAYCLDYLESSPGIPLQALIGNAVLAVGTMPG